MTLVAIMGFKLCATTLFVLSLLFAFLSRSGAEGNATYLHHNCSSETSFTANSTYQSKLNNLLASLTSNANRPTGFYNTTASSLNSVETVYGLFLCRGDISSDDCRDCVSVSTKDVVERCPRGKDAVAWYEHCMLRYANQSFFSRMDTEPGGIYMWKKVNKSDPTRFDLLVNTTMNDLSSGVTNVGSGAKKFGTKEANFTALQTLYTLAQCTPDLSGSDCRSCLQRAIWYLQDRWGKQGGRALLPSCNVRFEVYPFYNVNTSAPKPSTPALVPPPPGSVTKPKGKDQISAVIIIAIVVPISVSIVLFITGYCFLISWRAKKKDNAIQQENGSKRQLAFYNDVTASLPFIQDSAKLDEFGRKSDVQYFDLSTIIAATDDFSPAKRLGQGGFGPVYKGELANGQEIAVKTLSRSSKQGTKEFKNEVKLIAKLQHRNLVRLFGCCIHKEEKMLIYEYMPNKSLDFFIFNEIRRKLIDWRRRFEIISGIARGVLYLHQDSRLKIIHRDLKAGNILLDAAMNPKISDFGLARMFGDDQIEANTRKVVGTFGYMSPEYAMEGLYSIKSDVFSYGVLTLEIISGKRNNYHHIGSPSLNLIGHVWDLWMEGKALDIVDSLLGQEYPAQEVLRCIQIGLLCVQEQATDRPTMREIVIMLENEATVPSPKKPAFINRPINSGQDFSSSKGTPASLNEMTITMPEGR